MVWHFVSYRVAPYCNTLQRTATSYRVAPYCNTLQRTATHCNTLQHTATHCNTLQHTATRCNPLQPAATRCNPLQRTCTHNGTFWIDYATYTVSLKVSLWGCTFWHFTGVHVYNAQNMLNRLWIPSTHCNTLPHTATHCHTLPHALIIKRI